jgi:hypothetical protein
VTTLTNHRDTVRMPWSPTGTRDLVVRPVLGILYRLALGAMAGAFVPRFLRYERDGRAAIRWHWPAFLFPTVWAFYRKLWATGILLSALPFGLAALVARVDSSMPDSATTWIATAIIVVWGLPCIAAALAADSLLFRRVRREVREAEASCEGADDVVALLGSRRRTAPIAALALGGGMIVLLLNVALPEQAALYRQRVVRANVAAGIAAVAPLQRQVEEQWERNGSIPRRPDYAAVGAQRGAEFLDSVDLSAKTGRLRVALGAGTGELEGKALLLAPSIDAMRRIHWHCIAIDMPAHLLPVECRKA